MPTKTFWALAIGSMFFIGNVGTSNAEMFIYPKEGQSKEKQEMDEFQCHKWAVGQTGVDPMKQQPAPVAQVQPQTQSRKRGGLLRGAGRGAALGAVGGAIAGDAGKGAAIGAGVGALGGAMRRRQNERNQMEAQQQGQQQAAQQNQTQVQRYNKAKSVCLKGRGYSVE